MTRKGWKNIDEVTGARCYERYRYIPEDIVLNILPKLPVDSTLRFRCVSKQWRCLISRITNQRQKLIMSSTSSFEIFDPETLLTESINWESNNLHIYGSCNGLLLIRDYDDLYLWNPSISWCKKIFPNHDLGYCHNDLSGLCFDLENKDYKIVMAIRMLRRGETYGRVFVGSCKTKSWTRIHFPYRIFKARTGPVFNDYLHWYVPKLESRYCIDPNLIIYFETTRNVFEELPMPPFEVGKSDEILGVGVLHDCLCMTRKGGSCIEVLQMREYGVGESWSLLYRIKELSEVIQVEPLFSSYERGGEVLLKVDYGEYRNTIIACDTSGNLRKVTSLPSGNTFVYDETLIRPFGHDVFYSEWSYDSDPFSPWEKYSHWEDYGFEDEEERDYGCEESDSFRQNTGKGKVALRKWG